jgi:plastocyanin
MLQRSLKVAAFLMILGVVALLCSSGVDAAPKKPAASKAAATAQVVIEISGHAYHPPLQQVKPGTTVQWHNKDTDTAHTATSDAGSPFTFDTDSIPPGQFSKVITMPTTQETIPYHCEIHPHMHGKLQVSTTAPAAKKRR